MPNCFQLSRKTEPDKPVPLQTIDEEICRLLNEPVDPQYWCCSWYNAIGFSLACGKTFDQIREDLIRDWSDNGELLSNGVKLVRIVDWMKENFIPNAWAER